MSSTDKIDWKRVALEVRGKTMRLYWHIQKSDGLTMEEIKSKRGFTSRADIDQCLSKLRRLGLVQVEGGQYFVPFKIRQEAEFLLKWFMVWGNFVFPRSLIGAVGFTIMFIGLWLASDRTLGFLALGAIFAATFWIMTALIWLREPSRRARRPKIEATE